MRDPTADAAPAAVALVLAAAAVAASFLWQGSYGFNIGDEGFLWYGVQRVLAGEVPIRDFDAYDPGRYYWSALFMRAWSDDGLMSLRVAVALFQAAGLFLALWLLIRESSAPGALFWIVAAATLLAWMLPRHKLFDITLSIVLVAAIHALLYDPSPRRYFALGLVVGIVAIFGRNHGVYGVAGSLMAMASLAIGPHRAPGPARRLVAWAAGVALGYLPMVLVVALVPGFAQPFWETIRFIFEVESTNLPLPVPWPWAIAYSTLAPLQAAREAAGGIFFMLALGFGVLGVAWAILQRVRGLVPTPLVAACAFMALPYAHFAFSRPDIGHLAQGVFPALIGLLAIIAERGVALRWALASVLCAATLLVTTVWHPGFRCRMNACAEMQVGADRVRIDPGPGAALSAVTTLAQRYAPDRGTFFVAPLWPGAYAALRRKSPVWELYPLFPRQPAFERAEIARLRAADPEFVLIFDHPLDGHEALRYRNTHPLIERYVRENFVPVPAPAQSPAYQAYVKRGKS